MTTFNILLIFFTAAAIQTSSVDCKSSHNDFEFLSRVIGGKPARQGQLPYQLSLRSNGNHICGAVLIHSSTIHAGSVALTAAHCVEGGIDDENVLTVMGGSELLIDNHENNTNQILEVVKVVRHAEYNFPANDIAILFLSGDFTLTENLKPIKLPYQNENFIGHLLVSGWGKINITLHVLPNQLQFAEVPVVHNEKCADQYSQVYGSQKVIFDSNICAGYDHGGKDTCQDDSGSAGVGKDSSKTWTLYALTSWGKGCGVAGYPGVYTRVSSYTNWVEKQVAAENHI